MIAKVVKSGNSSNSGSFGRMAKYITDAQNGGHKADWIDVNNTASNDLDLAIAEVRAIQDLNSRAQHKSYHFVLSFPEGERPADEVIKEAESRAVEALGFKDHQRISALHANTENVHLHVIVNQINPETLKAVNPRRDYVTLDRVAKQVEKEYQLKPDTPIKLLSLQEQAIQREDIQQNLTPSSGKVSQDLPESLDQESNFIAEDIQHTPTPSTGQVIQPKSELPDQNQTEITSEGGEKGQDAERPQDSTAAQIQADRQPNADSGTNSKAYNIESHGGMRSFLSWVKDNAAQELVSEAFKDGATWQSLQDTASKYDLEFRTRGAGLVIASKTSKLYIKASDVDRELSRSKLENALGKFESKTSQVASNMKYTSYSPREKSESAKALYGDFKDNQDQMRMARNRALEQLRAQKEQARRDLVAANKKWRANTSGLNRYTQKDSRRVLMQDRYRLIQAQYDQQRTQILREYASPSWRVWLAQQAAKGNQDADKVLRSNIKKRLAMASIGNYEIDTDNLNPQIRPDGAVNFNVNEIRLSDDGNALHILPTTQDPTDESLAQSMALASQADKILEIKTFNPELGERMALTAATHGIKARFTDPALQRIYENTRSINPDSTRERVERQKTDRDLTL